MFIKRSIGELSETTVTIFDLWNTIDEIPGDVINTVLCIFKINWKAKSQATGM